MDMSGIFAWITLGLVAGSLAGIVIRAGEAWGCAILLAIDLTLIAGIGSGAVALHACTVAGAMAKRISWLRADPVLSLAYVR
jgi:hypothetical protein